MPQPIPETPQEAMHGAILFPLAVIVRRIDELAAILLERYEGQRPLFVCLLRGGVPFATRLMFSIARQNPQFHPELDYMTVASYGDRRTAGQAQLVMDLSPRTKPDGRPVIVLDDVLDSGETAVFTMQHLQQQGATSVALCVLVQKRKPQRPLPGDLLYGFETPDSWLTGMGLDDPHIGPEANRWADFVALARD